MKIKRMKKFVALLLSVLLIATMIPISVLAGDSGNTAPAVENLLRRMSCGRILI